MECLYYCVADRINLNVVEQRIKRMDAVKWNRHWNAIELYLPEKQQYCYVFRNGTLVSWNIKRYEIEKIIEIISSDRTAFLKKPLSDVFSYRIGKNTKIMPHEYFNVDCISLENNDSDLKLALSYGLSMSIKLSYYESLLESLIHHYNPLIQELSKKGRFTISRKRIGKILGDILQVKSELNLTSNFLYQPKFFWQHPALEVYYGMLEKYLDISERAEKMNQQLNTLNEIFVMFNSYLENKHSRSLEIVIIVLIAIEIIFNFLNLHW